MNEQEADDIERRLKEALISFTLEARQLDYKSDGLWTYKIKERLGDIGCNEFNSKICTSGFRDYFDNEWLFDLVWYLENEDGILIEIPLVVESEWHLDWRCIKYDFEKLLQSNATHRLMICQAHPSRKSFILEGFKSLIQSYRLNHTGDRYMIAVLDTEEEIFDFVLLKKE